MPVLNIKMVLVQNSPVFSFNTYSVLRPFLFEESFNLIADEAASRAQVQQPLVHRSLIQRELTQHRLKAMI
jgi:hypothetical protein